MTCIRKFLDLSTAHLSRSDRDHLDACAEPGSLLGSTTGRMPHGWFMFCPEELAAYSRADIPSSLRRIVRHARAQGCDYVLFDADADLDPALPVRHEDLAMV